MTSLTFVKDSARGVWEASLAGVTSAKVVEICRTGVGAVFVLGRLSGSSSYKMMGKVQSGSDSPDVIFEVGNDAGVSMDIKLVSFAEVTSGGYA